MGRQFPPAGGTGLAARQANRSAFRPSTFGAPLPSFLGMRRVRNRQFGTTVRRDAPRGNAPARRNAVTMQGERMMPDCITKHRRDLGTRDCFAEPVIGPANGRTRWLAMTAKMLS